MNKFIYALVFLMSVLFLGGCSSSNIRKFNPDPIQKTKIEKNLPKKVAVKVIMPKDDKDSIMCRMAGNIYLPSKMTYSQYINDAFEKVLLSADRLSDGDSEAKVLLITLTEVNFSSTSGEWYINASVKAGNNAPIKIKSITKFGTSWDASSACSNVANAFDEAVGNFVDEVLSNSKIIHALSS